MCFVFWMSGNRLSSLSPFSLSLSPSHHRCRHRLHHNRLLHVYRLYHKLWRFDVLRGTGWCVQCVCVCVWSHRAGSSLRETQ